MDFFWASLYKNDCFGFFFFGIGSFCCLLDEVGFFLVIADVYRDVDWISKTKRSALNQ